MKAADICGVFNIYRVPALEQRLLWPHFTGEWLRQRWGEGFALGSLGVGQAGDLSGAEAKGGQRPTDVFSAGWGSTGKTWGEEGSAGRGQHRQDLG